MRGLVRESGICNLEQLYTAAASRELDRLAIQGGLSGWALMRRAGRAVFDLLLRDWPWASRISICCGRGNNAGDGYVVAALALQHGMEVELIQLGDPASLQNDAATARDEAVAHGLVIEPSADGQVRPGGQVVVDALLGTGMKGAQRDAYARALDAVNGAGAPVVAVDLPSGVVADTGAAPGPAVRAHTTVTFIGRKIGLHTGAGAALAGRVIFADLGVGRAPRAGVPGIDWLTFEEVARQWSLPARDAGAYKQALGHVVVVGGDTFMWGAQLMAAEAALRVGAGMVTVVTRGPHRNAILSRRPELMVVDADDEAEVDRVLGRATVAVVGPGLGRGAWGRRLLERSLSAEVALVLDADGLVLLDGRRSPLPAGTIVTPHAAEAAGLLGVTVAEVAADRLEVARRLAARVNGLAVLKGAGTVIAGARAGGAEILGICAHGNPGMATAGMGDVLAGILGGLRAQGCDAPAATRLGTCLHSLAADRAAARLGQASLLATDILADVAGILREAADARPGGD